MRRSLRPLALLALLLASPHAARPQHVVSGQWSSFVAFELDEQLSRDDRTVDALATEEAVYVLANSTMATHQGPGDIVVAAYATGTGQLLWQANWGAPLSDEVGVHLGLSPDEGTLYIAGSRDASSHYYLKDELLVVALDTTDGSERWFSTWDHPILDFNWNDVAQDVVASDDGNWVYVTGNAGGASGDWILLKLSSLQGGISWEQFIAQDIGHSEGLALALSADGQTLYCAGIELGTPTLIALETNLGQELWRSTAQLGGNELSRVFLDEANARLHVFGFGDTTNEVLVSYDPSTGARRFGVTSPSGFFPPNAALAPDGSKILFASLQNSSWFGSSAIVECVDASSGASLWGANVTGPSGTSTSNFVMGAAFDASGTRALVTGRLPSAATQGDTWILAYDANSGAPQYGSLYDTGQAEEEPVRLMAHPTLPLCFTAGIQADAEKDEDLALHAYQTPTGNRLWSASLDSVGSAAERPLACAVDELGQRVYSAGYQVAAPGEHPHLSAFDAESGALLWSERVPFSDYESGRLVDVHTVGERVLATGWAGLPAAAYESLQAAYDGATGTLLWVEQTPAGGPGEELFRSDVSADGQLWVSAGHKATGFQQRRGLARARDVQSGAELWTHESLEGTKSTYHDVVLSPDGQRVYLVGEKRLTVDHLHVLALDAAQGTPLWSVTHPAIWSSGSSIAISPDGSTVVVTGRANGVLVTGSRNALTLAYDAASGDPLWEVLDQVPFDSQGRRVRVDLTNERALILGEVFTTSSTQQDLRLEARSLSNGQLLWEQIEDGGQFDQARTLHLSSMGGEVIVGSDSGTQDQFDWAGRARLTSYALEDGALLAESEFTSADLSANVRAVAVDAPRKRVWLVGEERTGAHSTFDLFGRGYELESLSGTPSQLFSFAGGTQDLALSVGPALAGRTYLLLGSASGNDPGPSFGSGLTLPLQPDAYLVFTLQNPNSSVLSGSLGVLDANGDAQAQLSVPPGLASLVGQSLWHAYVVLDGLGLGFVSQAVELKIE